MANIIKNGSTYAPTNNQGLDLTGSDFYAVIDIQPDADKIERHCHFTVDVYLNSTVAEARKNSTDRARPVDRINFSFIGDEYDAKIGSDGCDIPKAYALSLETLTDWESDEV